MIGKSAKVENSALLVPDRAASVVRMKAIYITEFGGELALGSTKG